MGFKIPERIKNAYLEEKIWQRIPVCDNIHQAEGGKE
jgi:hypothetical protein